MDRGGLRLLRHVIFETDLKVLFVTGAGISVKSGVPLYRSGKEESDSESEQPARPLTKDRSSSLEGEAYVAVSGDEAVPVTLEEPVLPPKEAKAKKERRRKHNQESSAIWSKKLTTLGQRLAFLSNPRAWYRYFWFDTHHVESFLQAAPNASHVSIGLLCERFPSRFKVITQNVDKLHQRAGCPLTNLIEVHGRIGVYRCTDLSRCEYGTDRTLYPEDLEFMSPQEEEEMTPVTGDDEIDGAFLLEARREPLDLAIPPDFPLPCCPKCRTVVMPMTLLFDEAYGTHQFFQIFEAQEWIMEADVYIFAGTSFSVHFTEMVLSRVRQSSSLALHINVAANDTGVFGGFDDYLNPREKRRVTSKPVIAAKEKVHLNWDSGSDQEAPVSTVSDFVPPTDLRRLNRPTVCEIVMPAEEAFLACLTSEYKEEVLRRLKEHNLRKLRRSWEVRD